MYNQYILVITNNYELKAFDVYLLLFFMKLLSLLLLLYIYVLKH